MIAVHDIGAFYFNDTDHTYAIFLSFRFKIGIIKDWSPDTWYNQMGLYENYILWWSKLKPKIAIFGSEMSFWKILVMRCVQEICQEPIFVKRSIDKKLWFPWSSTVGILSCFYFKNVFLIFGYFRFFGVFRATKSIFC